MSRRGGALGKTPGKDAQAEKATYVSLYGLEKTGEMARQIQAEAYEKLDALDRDAFLLREIAGYILNREN